ncbi:MAG TPA: SGNH/GDSL hydrolase family protein [Pedobacter sp.]|nr:SGNH/GDSL hydrolase family protein [Pedobacter sp.]
MEEHPEAQNDPEKINYLALGDSYTIGESVEQLQNFPHLLVDLLSKNGLGVNPPRIIARTGWTTGELITAIENSGLSGKFDFVTLLIGVNNQYRGQSQETYKKEFRQLLQVALNYASGNKEHVFVVSIPDWGVTPFARSAGRDQEKIGKEIDAFNAIGKQEAEALGISFTDITPGSRLAASDLGLIASDGLHPSAKMYKEWVEALAPDVLKILK